MGRNAESRRVFGSLNLTTFPASGAMQPLADRADKAPADPPSRLCEPPAQPLPKVPESGVRDREHDRDWSRATVRKRHVEPPHNPGGRPPQCAARDSKHLTFRGPEGGPPTRRREAPSARSTGARYGTPAASQIRRHGRLGGTRLAAETLVRRRDRNGHVLGGLTSPTKEARHRHPEAILSMRARAWRGRYPRTRHGTV